MSHVDALKYFKQENTWETGWDLYLKKPLWHQYRLECSFYSKGFPCGSASKESVYNVGDWGLIPGLGGSPGKGKGYLLWPEEFHGLYSP